MLTILEAPVGRGRRLDNPITDQIREGVKEIKFKTYKWKKEIEAYCRMKFLIRHLWIQKVLFFPFSLVLGYIKGKNS